MVNCLDVFMRHANGTAAKWDLIFFNSGLHNLDNSTRGLAAYRSQLGQIVAGLKRLQPQATLVWGTTTPFMPDKTAGNFAVEQQNAIAAKVMAANRIPSVDLYARVIARWVARRMLRRSISSTSARPTPMPAAQSTI